jgi:hypothetical protein
LRIASRLAVGLSLGLGLGLGLGLAAPFAFGESARAAGDPPFVGKWSVEGSKACTPQGGDNDLLLVVTTKKLSYYASSCVVVSSRRVSRSGDNAHRFKLRCTGEGTTTNSERILVVLEKNELRPDMLVHIDPADWSVLSYLRCAE